MKYIKKAGMAGFLVLSILTLPFIADQAEATTVNVIQYGAQADDNRLDTAAIQKAIDIVSETGGTVDIPAGTFDIAVHSSGNGIVMKSNVQLRMNAGTILKLRGAHLPSYRLISVSDVQNVKITGGTLVGDRTAHTGDDDEWGHGIHITGNASSVYVNGVTAKNFSGDGFTIENNLDAVKKVPDKVKLDRVTADYNRRQGLSIIAGTNITITNSTFKHTEGTPSSAGIALERDKPYTLPLENVVIQHNRIQNNGGYGLIFAFSHHSRAEYNIIRSNKEGGVFLNSAHGHTLYGNKISRNGGHLSKPYLSSGVFIRGGENNVISANDISQNAERGVYALDHVNGNEIIHNNITDNGHTAIETNDGNGLVIKNNHVSGTHDAVIIHNSSSSVVSNNGSSVSFIPPAEEPGPAADSSSLEKEEIEEKIDRSDSLSRLKEALAEKSLPASLKRAIFMY